MFSRSCAVVENRSIAPRHWILKLRSATIAKQARPGQFAQILCVDDSYDPLLPRPFSFLDVQANEFSILYHVVGKGTELLSRKKKGDTLRVLGPLGNGFTLKAAAPARPAGGQSRLAGVRGEEVKVLVGGGVGIPPLYHLAKTWVTEKLVPKDRIHIFLGARDKSLLLCEKDFVKLGVKRHVATDDGSRGIKGFITVVFQEFLKSQNSKLRPHVFACGPTPMLKAVAQLAGKYEVPCEVSVEVPMACGFGACLGCAIKIRTQTTDHGRANDFRFAIACAEGPVFQGSEIVWE